ncbi:MAG: hypothetical protein ACLFWM_08500, partial [Actinomycetota bacterium]
MRRRWAVAAAISSVPILWLVAATVDREALARAWNSVLEEPLGLLVALTAFAAAFSLRAVAWRRILPDLPFGQAWAALHV